MSVIGTARLQENDAEYASISCIMDIVCYNLVLAFEAETSVDRLTLIVNITDFNIHI